MTPSPTLSAEEVRSLCGGYVQPSKQLKMLHELGYWRAWRSRLTGKVILERAHAEAVGRGQDAKMQAPALRPAPKLRAA